MTDWDSTSTAAFSQTNYAIYEPEDRRGAASPNNINRVILNKKRVYSADSFKPVADALNKFKEKQRKIAEAYYVAKANALVRLNTLKFDAAEEGISISDKSEKDFNTFIEEHVFMRRPYLSLLDNGNVRALWKNADNEQIGLQFRGDREIQFVFFSKRKQSTKLFSSSGRDTFEGIMRQISALELLHLLKA